MRVLVFGASSAQGYWDSKGGWADRLKHYYDKLQMHDFSREQPKVMNLGVSGDTTASLLKRVGPESKARQNEKGLAIIIQVGSNNAAEQNGKLHSTAQEYQIDLEAIIKKSEEFTFKVLVVGLPAVEESKTNPIDWADLYFKNANIAIFETAARKITDKLDIPFVPVHQEFLNRMQSGGALHAHDGLHPNDEGHELIFQLVQPELDKILRLG
jgi:lysophospholipase L1-like esterase